MNLLIWPGTVAVVSIIFFLLFKRPISDLLNRTRGVGRYGIQMSSGTESKDSTDSEKQYAALESRLRASYKDEIAKINAQLIQAQEDIAQIKTELIQFQQNIGYTRGSFHD